MVKENSDCTIESTGQYNRSFIGISTCDLDNYPIKYLISNVLIHDRIV